MTNDTEVHQATTRTTRRISPIALVAFGLAVLVGVLAVMAGFGSRWGLWGFRTGFQMLRWAAYGGIATAVLAAIAVFVTRPGGPRRGFALAFAALVVGILAVAIPWQSRRSGASLPPIHDLTTDVNNPPQFVAIAPLRADAPNPIEYDGPEVAAQQQRAYPGLQPVLLEMPLDRAFQRAFDAAEQQGWRIVEANVDEGRIEATDRTFWFGFYDDVVIRLTPVDGRTVVDVRSKSRVGGHDFGTNANRILDYLEDVRG